MINSTTLSERQWTLLQAIAEETGQTPDELVAEAVERLIQQFQPEQRLASLRQARGMWQDRSDLPSLTIMRSEWERSTPIDD